MGYWLVDRMLPGLAATAIWAIPAFLLQHYALARKFRDVTREQTADLKQHLQGHPPARTGENE